MKEIIQQLFNPSITQNEKAQFNEVYSLFRFHQLENLLFYGWEKGLIEADHEEILKLKKIHQTAIYKTTFQEEELKLIEEAFQKENISYLPLKGAILRNWYPSPDMRSMADLDILVELIDFKKVKKILLDLGYEMKHEGGNHDVYHKRPFMNIEIHRQMIDESYALSKYYQSIWSKLKQTSNSLRLDLSSEDFYLFVIAHGAKHFSNGGTGIRLLLDIYFVLKHFQKLDEVYLKTELEKMGLVYFEATMRRLSYHWLEGAFCIEGDEVIEGYMLKSGVYGTREHFVASHLAMGQEIKSLNKSKIKYLLEKAFPSYSFMKRRYPSLKYFFLFLPFYYLARIIKVIINREVFSQTKQVKQIQEKDIEEQKEIKKKVGSIK